MGISSDYRCTVTPRATTTDGTVLTGEPTDCHIVVGPRLVPTDDVTALAIQGIDRPVEAGTPLTLTAVQDPPTAFGQ